MVAAERKTGDPVHGGQGVARRGKQGAELRAKMRPGKVYLYQLYTDIFVEFPDMATADAFRAAMSKSSPGWDIDPVAVIDTSDPAQAKNWAANMGEGGESHG